VTGHRTARSVPLPRTVSPILNETVDSYIWRLARANHLNPDDLRSHLGAERGEPIGADRLAAVSGAPVQSLRYAMLELCDPGDLASMNVDHRPRPGRVQQAGCRRCAASQGVVDTTGRMKVWARHEDVVCLRHRHWAAADKVSLDLARHPEIVQANRVHRRLIRRHGRIAVQLAYQDAVAICQRWIDTRNYDDPFDQRMDLFLGTDWKFATNNAAYRASFYPEVAHLTRLLSSPYWTSLILNDHVRRDIAGAARSADGQLLTWEDAMFTRHFAMRLRSPGIDRFVAEAKRTIKPNFQWIPEPHSRQFGTLGGWVLDRLTEQITPEPEIYPTRRPASDAFLRDRIETITEQTEGVPDPGPSL
jgi:hypothetical protein